MVYDSNEINLFKLYADEESQKQNNKKYFWVKYANDIEGNGMSDDSVGKSYIGIAYNKDTKVESDVKTDYTWTLIKGDDGQDGYTIYFDNEFINIPTDENGKVINELNFNVNIYAFKGTVSLTPTIKTLPTIKGLTITNKDNIISITVNKGTNLSDNGYIPIVITIDSTEFTKNIRFSKNRKGVPGTHGVYVFCGKETYSINCKNSGLVDGALSIEIPFDAYEGNNKIDCTVSYSTLPDGMTLNTLTQSTTSEHGKIILDVENNATLGGLSNGVIRFVFTASGKTFVRYFTWCKVFNGKDSSNITSIEDEYATSANKDTLPNNDDWSTNIPTFSQNLVLWIRKKVTAKNKETDKLETTYTTPILDEYWETLKAFDKDYTDKITTISDSISGISSIVDENNKSITDKIWQDDFIQIIKNYDDGEITDDNGTVIVTNQVLSKVNETTKTLETQEEKISELNTIVNGENGENGLTQKYNDVKKTVDDSVSKIATIQQTQNTYNEKQSKLEQSYTDFKASVENYESETTGNFTTINKDISTIKEDANTFKTSVENYEIQTNKDVSSVKSDLSTLTQTVNGFKLEVSETMDSKITKVEIQYALGDSNKDAPTSGWSTTPPPWEDNKYMWQKTLTTYDEGETPIESDPICISGAKGKDGTSVTIVGTLDNESKLPKSYSGNIGDAFLINGIFWVWTDKEEWLNAGNIKGENGADGVSIDTIFNYYLASPNDSDITINDDNWTPNIQNMSLTNKFLWNYQKILYSNSTTHETSPHIIGVYGDTGRGIASIVNYYLASTDNNSITKDTNGWTPNIQDVNSSKKYLWNYEIITYDDGTTMETDCCIIGNYSVDGRGISSTNVTYQTGTSGTTKPTGTWSPDIPTVKEGQYLWTKTTYTFTDNKTQDTYSVSYHAIDGTNGSDGKNGVDGRGILSTTVTYQTSSSGTTAPTGTWSIPVPNVSKGQYLWTKTTYTFTDNTTQNTYSVGYAGTNGTNGTNGEAVKTITNYYLASSSASGVTTSTDGWGTTIQTISKDKPYLWNYEVVTGSNGTTLSTTSPIVIGHFGTNGTNGKNGVDGVSITNIDEHYAVSNDNKNAPSTWYKDVQTMTISNKYLWNYETINYSDGTSDDTLKRVIGAYGNTGATGNGIKNTTITYQTSSSGTTKPTGTWSPDIPTVNEGDFLWTKTTYTFTNNTTQNTYSVSYHAIDGTNGSDGKNGIDGRGISFTTITYQAGNSGTTKPTGTWSPDIPTVNKGQYLWTKTTYTFTDNTTQDTYSVGYAGTNGSNGTNGEAVKTITNYYLASSSASGVSTSTSGWSTTIQTISKDKPYLWNYEVVTGSNGTTLSTTSPVIIGHFGSNGTNGTNGKNGVDGVSITNIDEHYAVSNDNKNAPSTWYKDVQTMTTSNKYLWNYETINYSDGTSDDTLKRVIGAYGNTGATGNGIKDTVITYQTSSSGTTKPTGTWSPDIPTVNKGQYLWTKTTYIYSDNKTQDVYSVGYSGTNGTNGTNGEAVKTITNYYLATTASSGVTTSTDGWGTTIQTISKDKPYLWNYEVVKGDKNTTLSTTSPVIIGHFGSNGTNGTNGKNGVDGVSITGITEHYAVSNDNKNAPSTWYEDVQTMTISNKYLWNYETINYSDNTSEDTKKRVIGAYGNTGLTGKGIKDTVITYQAGTSGTTKPTGTWSPDIPTVNKGQYLWTKTTYTYSDNKTQDVYSVGYSGTNGEAVKTITNYYLATTASSGVSTSTSGWSTTIQTISKNKPYLWNYEVVKSNIGNTISTTSPVIIGHFGTNGTNGTNGTDGVGISGIDEYYAVNNDKNTIPSTWYPNVQQMSKTNKFLWNYEVIKYTNNTTEETNKRIIGVYGDTGNNGADGKSIDSVTTLYYKSTSKTSIPDDKLFEPYDSKKHAWEYGYYLWTCYKVIYKNPTETVYMGKSCDSSWESSNEASKKATEVQANLDGFKVTVSDTYADKTKIISTINQTTESITIDASKVNLNGYVTFTNLSTSGQTSIDGGNIKANTITADKLNVTDLTAFGATLASWRIVSKYIYADIGASPAVTRVQMEVPTSDTSNFLSIRVGSNDNNGWSTNYTAWAVKADGTMTSADAHGEYTISLGQGKLIMTTYCTMFKGITQFKYDNGTITLTDTSFQKFKGVFGTSGISLTNINGGEFMSSDIASVYPYFKIAVPFWINNKLCFTDPVSGSGIVDLFTGFYRDGYRLIWQGWTGESGNFNSTAEMSFFKETTSLRRCVLRPEVNGNGVIGTTSYRWDTAFFTNAITASDRKIKSNITTIDDEFAKNFVLYVNPCRFKMKKEDGCNGLRWKFGFIAQEVSEIAKKLNLDMSLVYAVRVETVKSIDKNGNERIEKFEYPYNGESSYIDDDGNEIEITDDMLSWGINYEQCIPILYKFTQDFYSNYQQTINNQQLQINELKAENEQMKKDIESLKNN